MRNEKGNLVSETPYKRQLRCAPSGLLEESRNMLVTLKPQESREEEIVVTRLFELGLPGTYSIEVWRKVPEQLGGAIQSNVLTITMTQ